MKTIFTLAIVALLSTTAFSQKVAHINTNALVELMPEKAEAEMKLKNMAIEFESLLTELLDKYNVMYTDLVQNGDNWSDVIKRIKEDELQRLQETIEKAKQSAQEELTKLEYELVQPILEKAKTASTQFAN